VGLIRTVKTTYRGNKNFIFGSLKIDATKD